MDKGGGCGGFRITERIGNPERAPNGPLGHRTQQRRIPCICLNPADPP
jgi:hypothetical protein